MEAEIPVMGHVGLTPQSLYHLGSFKVKGNREEEVRTIVEGAENLQKAGAFAVVLECVPLGAGPFDHTETLYPYHRDRCRTGM